MTSVKIQKVGAIDFINFNLPEGQGGVRLFVGTNGAGKTTALKCLLALLGRKVPLEPTDDAPKGTVEGLGRSITVQKRQTTKGEVELPNLEGRFDFSDLVDPPIAQPAARNKARIKALVGLAGTPASPDDFKQLFENPEQFKAIVGDELPKAGDVIDMAAAVKKACESAARVHEVQVDQDQAEWTIAVQNAAGAKADQPPKPVNELADAYAAAQRAKLEAQSKIDQVNKANAHNAAMVEKLKAHEAAKPKMDMERSLAVLKNARAMVADLEAKLATAKQTVLEAQKRYDEASQWELRLDEIRDSMIQVSDEPLPNILDLEMAEGMALDNLRKAEETRKKFDAAVTAKKLTDSIKNHSEQAEKLRTIAQKVFDVVSTKLPEGCPLQVREFGEDKTPVLCAYHDGRGDWVPYDELSEGERWKAALGIAIKAVGPGGVIPTAQEAWQSLDESARQWVAKTLQNAKVWLISGMVGEGDLRVEEYKA